MDDDKRNLVLAILLSVLILIGWNYLAPRFFPEALQGSAPLENSTPTASQSAADVSQEVLLSPPAISTARDTTDTVGGFASGFGLFPSAPALLPSERALKTVIETTPRIAIATPKLAGSINLIGARLDDLTFTQYRQRLDKKAPNVRLFAPSGTQRAYFASIGWVAPEIIVPDEKTRWSANTDKLTPDTPVRLTWRNETGQTFQIDYEIDAHYLITVKQSVTNSADRPIEISSFSYINRLGGPVDVNGQDSITIHIGPMGVFNDAADYDWDYEDIAEAPGQNVSFESTGGWIGFTDKYWLAAVIPDPKDKISAAFRAGKGSLYQSNFIRPPDVIGAGQTISRDSHIFAGAKEVNLLKEYQSRLGIAHLDRAIDWGWFYWFEQPIFSLLDWLFRMSGNFGVAIMILTLIIRLLMFPIAQKQFHSMAQMRVLQPKMKTIQDKFKEDKPRLQQELMKLYKDEKVNPLAGCLPIFLQIPIFYALYKVLMLMVEMRHQPFILWIKDLSAPDPLHVLNLFGLLPFTPPAFLGLGVLAILLGVTMWLQFRLNPAPTDPVQKQVFALMPWMMMFIMAPFAAGLLLYWITSNILTIAQQRWLYSRYPALKTAAPQVKNPKS